MVVCLFLFPCLAKFMYLVRNALGFFLAEARKQPSGSYEGTGSRIVVNVNTVRTQCYKDFRVYIMLPLRATKQLIMTASIMKREDRLNLQRFASPNYARALLSKGCIPWDGPFHDRLDHCIRGTDESFLAAHSLVL